MNKNNQVILKAFFKNGIPVWGLLFKNKEKKFEGIFSFKDS